jgi:hypothetical protein
MVTMVEYGPGFYVQKTPEATTQHGESEATRNHRVVVESVFDIVGSSPVSVCSLAYYTCHNHRLVTLAFITVL